MPTPISMDLRLRIVRAVERGSSIRAAARRFAVSPSAAIKLMQRVRATGSAAPERYGGHRRPVLELHEADLKRLVARPSSRSNCSDAAGPGSRRSTTRSAGSACGIKKVRESGRAAPAPRRPKAPAVAGLAALHGPGTFVFLDETGTATNMARRYGRSPSDRRLVAAVPHGRWRTTTFIAGLRHAGIPTSSCSTILAAHKIHGVHQAIVAAGASILYLPAYSPDHNPIEQLFPNLKALLRKAAARTKEELWSTLGHLLDACPATTCANYLRHCGYGLDRAEAKIALPRDSTQGPGRE